MSVADNGVGLPPEFDEDRSQMKSVGLVLVETLTQQLDGRYSVKRLSPGTAFVIAFEREDASKQLPVDAYPSFIGVDNTIVCFRKLFDVIPEHDAGYRVRPADRGTALGLCLPLFSGGERYWSATLRIPGSRMPSETIPFAVLAGPGFKEPRRMIGDGGITLLCEFGYGIFAGHFFLKSAINFLV